MSKALISRLRSEVVDPEVCHGFTTDKVNPTKAAGPDKIHPSFLHHLGLISISLLTSIVYKSWASTKVPHKWGTANIRSIPRVGKDLQKMDGYRPMSLTSIVGKIIEHLVTKRLPFFESKHLFAEHQAGLRHGRNTEDQLLQLSIHRDGFQQSPMQRTIVALINYSRACDYVWRDALLMTMSQ